jgi:biopolymer transport protein ExbB
LGPDFALRQMGVLAKIVVGILFIMSGWSIGMMIDRAMAFSAARKQSRAFAPAVAGALRDGKIDEAIKVAERNKKSHLAKVVTAGLMEFRAHQESGEIPGETIEASKRALERTEAIVHAELKRGLGGLATIGSTAPFVGLFGTVVGILNAFKGISQEKATGLAAVAGGIAEALVTTAIGLFVAIPAVMMFNHLTGRVEAFDVEMDNSSSELIDYFLKRRLVAAEASTVGHLGTAGHFRMPAIATAGVTASPKSWDTTWSTNVVEKSRTLVPVKVPIARNNWPQVAVLVVVAALAFAFLASSALPGLGLMPWSVSAIVASAAGLTVLFNEARTARQLVSRILFYIAGALILSEIVLIIRAVL